MKAMVKRSFVFIFLRSFGNLARMYALYLWCALICVRNISCVTEELVSDIDVGHDGLLLGGMQDEALTGTRIRLKRHRRQQILRGGSDFSKDATVKINEYHR